MQVEKIEKLKKVRTIVLVTMAALAVMGLSLDKVKAQAGAQGFGDIQPLPATAIFGPWENPFPLAHVVDIPLVSPYGERLHVFVGNVMYVKPATVATSPEVGLVDGTHFVPRADVNLDLLEAEIDSKLGH